MDLLIPVVIAVLLIFVFVVALNLWADKTMADAMKEAERITEERRSKL